MTNSHSALGEILEAPVKDSGVWSLSCRYKTIKAGSVARYDLARWLGLPGTSSNVWIGVYVLISLLLTLRETNLQSTI